VYTVTDATAAELDSYTRVLYDNCHGPCACNDKYLPSLARCSITDEDVRIFFDPAQDSPAGMNADCQQVFTPEAVGLCPWLRALPCAVDMPKR
jgi:hypothetical protein